MNDFLFKVKRHHIVAGSVTWKRRHVISGDVYLDISNSKRKKFPVKIELLTTTSDALELEVKWDFEDFGAGWTFRVEPASLRGPKGDDLEMT